MSLFDFLIRNRSEVLQLTFEHLLLVLLATGAAAVVGIPVGILLTRRASLAKPVLAIANILQTIPSLALFGFLIPILGSYGIGRVPAIIALFLYSLLPIIRNTFTGINGVDPAVREAARGMGMTDWQLLTQVEYALRCQRAALLVLQLACQAFGEAATHGQDEIERRRRIERSRNDAEE